LVHRERLKHQVVLLFFQQFRLLAVEKVGPHLRMATEVTEEAAAVLEQVLVPQVRVILLQQVRHKEIMAGWPLVLAHMVVAAAAARVVLVRQVLRQTVGRPKLLQLLEQLFIMLAAEVAVVTLQQLPVWEEGLQQHLKKVALVMVAHRGALALQTLVVVAAEVQQYCHNQEVLEDLAL
jgi:hypothetical protein